jgi:hypothetical protein
MRHSLYNFVYGAISAQNKDRIRALRDQLLSEFARMARSGRRPKLREPSYPSKRSFGTLKNSFGITPDFASGGIIDYD